MVGENKAYKSSDEYKLKEEETLGDFSDGEQNAPGAMAPIQRKKPGLSPGSKRLLVPLLLIAIIIVVYNIMGWYSNRKARIAQEAMEAAQKQVPPPALVQAPPRQPVAPPVNIFNEQLKQEQGAIEKKLNDLTQQDQDNRDKLSALNDIVVKNQQDIATINQYLGDLSTYTQSMAQTLQKLTAPKVKPKKKVVKAQPLPSYHIRAVVPGRAWIASEDGKARTVRVGDKLEGYGTVEVISPREGVIITSTGGVIQYGNNDI